MCNFIRISFTIVLIFALHEINNVSVRSNSWVNMKNYDIWGLHPNYQKALKEESIDKNSSYERVSRGKYVTTIRKLCQVR